MTRVCFTTNWQGRMYDVTLTQHGLDSFCVTYGSQVKDNLTYAEAARELGSCIMHALACEGHVETGEGG